MGSIASAKLVMGYTVAPEPGSIRCKACGHGSWEERHSVRGASTGLWCAAGQFWVCSAASCREATESNRAPEAQP